MNDGDATVAHALHPAAVDGIAAKAAHPLERLRKRRAILLVALPTIVIFVGCLIALITIVVFSFWKALPFGMRPDFTLENYVAFFSAKSYVDTLIFTLEVGVLLIPVMVVIAYPVCYFIAFLVRDERVKLFLLLLCIVPLQTLI